MYSPGLLSCWSLSKNSGSGDLSVPTWPRPFPVVGPFLRIWRFECTHLALSSCWSLSKNSESGDLNVLTLPTVAVGPSIRTQSQ